MKRFCTSLVVMLAFLWVAAPVKAATVIDFGGLPGAANVNFDQGGGPAPLIQATEAGSGLGLLVNFFGAEEDGAEEDLVAPAQGQARIEAADGLFTTLMIQLDHPLGAFEAISFNLRLQAQASGEVTITADSLQGQESATLPIAQGENRINVIAMTSTGDLLTKITLDTMGTVGIADLRQVRIEGAQIIPLPASVWAGASLFGLLAAVRLRRMMKA